MEKVGKRWKFLVDTMEKGRNAWKLLEREGKGWLIGEIIGKRGERVVK